MGFAALPIRLKTIEFYPAVRTEQHECGMLVRESVA